MELLLSILQHVDLNSIIAIIIAYGLFRFLGITI